MILEYCFFRSIWPKFDWISSVKWLRSLTDLPITVKGIQTWEDALLCYQHGAHPWLSNHGGRQLEAAPSAAETLLEIRRYCPQVLKECDVIVDGGIRRGSDVVKALALGARAVGLGRSFLFALTYGEAGVSKAFQILQHEVETTMALLGVTSIAQLTPEYVSVFKNDSGTAADSLRLHRSMPNALKMSSQSCDYLMLVHSLCIV